TCGLRTSPTAKRAPMCSTSSSTSSPSHSCAMPTHPGSTRCCPPSGRECDIFVLSQGMGRKMPNEFMLTRGLACRMGAAALMVCAAAAPARADTVVVTADRMIDVLAGRVVDHPQITIIDGRIAAVAAEGTDVPANARRVDLPGMTLLPGLIDMHTHITAD